MQLLQLDVVGGVVLVDSSKAEIVTGVDGSLPILRARSGRHPGSTRADQLLGRQGGRMHIRARPRPWQEPAS